VLHRFFETIEQRLNIRILGGGGAELSRAAPSTPNARISGCAQ